MVTAYDLGTQIKECWKYYSQEGLVKSNMLASSKGSIYNSYALKNVINPTALSDGALGYVYSFYRNAYDSLLDMLIIGPPESRSKRELHKNFGISSNIDGRQDRSKPEIFEDEAMVHRGAIMYEKNYSPLLNDVWVLGGIHKCIPFYLKSFPSHKDLVQDRALWKEDDGRMGMLARELLMLECFLYQRVQPENAGLGAVFVPSERMYAAQASLQQFIELITRDAYSKKRELLQETRDFVNKGVPYDTFSYLDKEFAGFITRAMIVYVYEPGFTLTQGPWLNVLCGQVYVALRPSNVKGPLQIYLVDAEYEENDPQRASSTRRSARNASGWVNSYDYLVKHLGK